MRRPAGFRALLACLVAIAGAAAGAAAAAPLEMAAIVVSKAESGVAPLSVFFDATGIKSPATDRSFMEMDCSWNFGDDDKVSWRNGTGANNKKNRAHGLIAAHVYETPGTYKPLVSCSDGAYSSPVTVLESVVVADPDTVYAGASTRCYSRSGSFDGCPVGANQVTDGGGDFTAIIARDLRQGRRLLFHRGETWLTPAMALLNVNGPWTIGAYGSGEKPVIRWSGGPSILGIGWSGSNTYKDARLIDLVLDMGPVAQKPFPQAGVTYYGKFDQVTFLRMDMPGGVVQDLMKPKLTDAWDLSTVADSTIGPISAGALGGYGMYLSSSRTAVLGTLVDNNGGGEHNVRVMHMDKLVVSHNTFLRPHALKANLTLRGVDWHTGIGPKPARTYSQHAVVSDNKFVGAPNVSVPVNTSIDASHEARTRYLVFERNWWINQVATVTALNLNSSFSAVRHNIFDMSAGAGGQAIGVTNNKDTQSATGNAIYNNTIYAKQSPPAHVRGIRIFNGAVDTAIKNNLMYAPSAKSAIVVDATLGAGTVGASGTLGNSSDAQAKNVDPLFANASRSFSKPADFRPGAGSYAIGAGVGVPARHDFFRKAQGSARDIGAVAH